MVAINSKLDSRTMAASLASTRILIPRMKITPVSLGARLAIVGTALLVMIGPLGAAELIKAKDGSGVYGYKDTPRLPWCQWLVHDPDRPNPKRVEPGKAGPPAPVPADAQVLFDGTDLSKWEAGAGWKVEGGCI